jgi:hypothetical protein
MTRVFTFAVGWICASLTVKYMTLPLSLLLLLGLVVLLKISFMYWDDAAYAGNTSVADKIDSSAAPARHVVLEDVPSDACERRLRQHSVRITTGQSSPPDKRRLTMQMRLTDGRKQLY